MPVINKPFLELFGFVVSNPTGTTPILDVGFDRTPPRNIRGKTFKVGHVIHHARYSLTICV